MSIPISVLELSPIPTNGNGVAAIQNTLAMAQLAEDLGYSRFWLAEHHNMGGLACVAPEVLIGVIAQQTRRIRVGSGGVLLPNYAPLKVAELFRTLEAITPGRIDLGIGRAPNQDPRTALALRRNEDALKAADDIGRLVAELEGFAQVAPSAFPEGHALRDVIASPEDVPFPPIYLLGSGQLSAQLAATRGRGFAAAYHFSPLESEKAIKSYKAAFQPSPQLAKPHAILTLSVICAETEALADGLMRAGQLAALRRLNGERGGIPTIEEARAYQFTDEEIEKVKVFKPIYGNPIQVHGALTDLETRYNADELQITTNIGDHALRKRSFELIAKIFELGGVSAKANQEEVEMPALW